MGWIMQGEMGQVGMDGSCWGGVGHAGVGWVM